MTGECLCVEYAYKWAPCDTLPEAACERINNLHFTVYGFAMHDFGFQDYGPPRNDTEPLSVDTYLTRVCHAFSCITTENAHVKFAFKAKVCANSQT